MNSRPVFKVVLLGTGGPKIDPDRMGPATLVNLKGNNYLFDAGRGAAIQLARSGVEARDLHAIFITHHHFDHLSSLDDVLFCAWNEGRSEVLPVYGPPGTASIVESLFNDIYQNDIRFRELEAQLTGNTLSDIREMIQVIEIERGIIYQQNGISIECQPVKHGHGLGISNTHWHCLGYNIQHAGKFVAISGDCVDCEGLRALSQEADLLVQCCYLAEAEIIDEEHRIIAEHILACSTMAGEIAVKANVKAIALTHLRRKTRKMLRQVELDVKKSFSGRIYVGHDLMNIIV